MNNESNQEIQEPYEKFEKLCYDIIGVLNDVLLDYERDYLVSLISHNEGGIALEDMIAAIKFHNITLTKLDFDKIETAGKLMGLNRLKWVDLKWK